jgi:hypothetical protein
MMRNRHPLFLLLLATFMSLVSGALPRHALADAAQASCKPELRAEGRRSDPGSAEEKASDALKFSISKWTQLAEGLYGSQFASWESAKGRKIECDHYDEPAHNGRISCVAIARPCEKR